jgi:hypothetical protein
MTELQRHAHITKGDGSLSQNKRRSWNKLLGADMSLHVTYPYWREKCKDRKKTVERNRKAGQNPPRVVAPTEEEEEEDVTYP